ncbi:hypothetical protein HF855_10075 [Dorea formicigenerans]|uniref:Uncharacterized protein n=1 Tax=Dorea formicigenerans TaxID=39486 RepID=A0A848CRY7_9FIRM|nr:hypothetical protein [Dorea formicigenerans]NME57751.1 hypothetical protein [Dorea formicigenerans]
MKCSVLIDSSLIDKEDVRTLNESDNDISYSATETSGFLPTEVVLVLIDLAQNIGYSAAYDAIKYVAAKIVLLISKKRKKESETRFELTCNGKKFSMKMDCPLTEQQVDKLVDAAAQALLSEWSETEQRGDNEE